MGRLGAGRPPSLSPYTRPPNESLGVISPVIVEQKSRQDVETGAEDVSTHVSSGLSGLVSSHRRSCLCLVLSRLVSRGEGPVDSASGRIWVLDGFSLGSGWFLAGFSCDGIGKLWDGVSADSMAGRAVSVTAAVLCCAD